MPQRMPPPGVFVQDVDFSLSRSCLAPLSLSLSLWLCIWLPLSFLLLLLLHVSLAHENARERKQASLSTHIRVYADTRTFDMSLVRMHDVSFEQGHLIL